ncbi:aspartate kinase [Enterococcus camelliae]|uniref:Aspartokinase n=1 Tax=Enterococcus camelliae TaxID=453959 RepID=A0ABW5TGR7_9ENTE
MKVAKFGGSSLASAQQVQKVVNIIQDDSDRRFVVVSAPGKRSKDDIKVTDLLIAFHDAIVQKKEYEELLQTIFQRYEEIGSFFQVDANILAQIRQHLRALAENADPSTPYFYDRVLASGEDNNARLIAGVLKSQGISARYVSPADLGMIVSEEPKNAQILPEAYPNLHRWHDAEDILVIPGFFGITKTGEVCTFSRGGSDITGAIVAAGVKADLYENFTDVDGIFVANPGYVHNPVLIKELTYREMRELAYSGFGVFHEEALMPSFKAHIPVVIKNTNNPSSPGTIITNEHSTNEQPVVGIASDEGFSMIYISKYLMNREVGFTLRVLKIFQEFNLNYEHMPSGIDDISIIIRARQLNPELEEELLRRIAYEIDPDELRITHDLSMVVVVGEGMKHRVGITADSTAALARKQINLEMINQGSSEVSIMFGIHKEQEKLAIRTLYYTFFD